MSDDNNKEYKGPGKFNAALGRGTTEGIVGEIGGAVIGAGVGLLIKNPVKGALVGSSIGGVGGFVHGAYKGVGDSRAAKEQVEQLNAALDAKDREIGGFAQRIEAERAAAKDKGPKIG